MTGDESRELMVNDDTDKNGLDYNSDKLETLAMFRLAQPLVRRI